MMRLKRIVFVDFDGTITSEDTLAGAMQLFIPPEEYEAQHQELREGRLTLSQALHRAFDGAPATILPQMVDYVKQVPIRPGFCAFLEAMESLAIPVVVISGGLKQLIEVKLASYLDRLHGIHYAELADNGDGTLQLVCPYDDGVELMRKTDIMAQYDYDEAICVGDSYTDINMAKASQMVFARDILEQALKKEGMPFFSWNNFHDVTQEIISSR